MEYLLYKLRFFFKLSGLLVRPVDFIKEALSPNGNYEIAGYYAGNMSSVCTKTFQPALSENEGNDSETPGQQSIFAPRQGAR